MLTWFKDAALTLPVKAATPKWFSFPLKGSQKTASIWLGDAYTSIVSQAIGSGDTTIHLTQTDEFPTSGVITIDLEDIQYTGVTPSPTPTLTGCTRGFNSTTATGHTVGTTVFPHITYTSSGNITVFISGMVAGPSSLSLAVPTGSFGPPGVPLLLSISTINSGVANAVEIRLQLSVPVGPEQKYTNLSVSTTPMTRPGDTVSGFATIVVQPPGVIYVQQRDQGLKQRLRLLPLNRKIAANLPGFEWGQYRWRDNTSENAKEVVPTRWDIDTSLITQDFIGGVGSIGETNDIEPIDLEEKESSIFLRSRRGQYFTGVKRYYLPSDNFNLEFLPCYPSLPFTYTLLKPPKEQTPVFVGRWRLDGQLFYETDKQARYRFPGTFDPISSEAQFMVDRKTGVLTVNAATQIPQTTILLGVLSGGTDEQFDMPFYPLDKIVHLYVGDPIIPIPTFAFDRENGSVSFAKVPGTNGGQPLFAVVDAAIAVLYEYDVPDNTEIQNTNIPDEVELLKNTRLLTPDLNPAFSGLSSGFVYLQHRVLKPVKVTLSADKPQIAIPPTLSSIIGLIAYGPIFYNGDHALLTATAIGSLPNEVVPGAHLQVIPGGLDFVTGLPLQNYPFRGLINGKDPNTESIVVITGGDGIANLVFQPSPNFGFYIPTVDPWVTESTDFVPTAATWLAGIATLTFTAPMSHKFAANTTVRLDGFTPSAWNGDFRILTIDTLTNQFTIGIAVNPGPVTIMGDAGPTDTLLLPVPIPISQIWAGPPNNEGWLEFVYAVLNNDPLFGVSSPGVGDVPFVENGVVNGTIVITNAVWSGGTADFKLASVPTGLEVGQNVDIIGCTTSTLNGVQNVLSITFTGGFWHITTPTTGSGSEAEGSASFKYSNFRTNGVLDVWKKNLVNWEASKKYQVGDQIRDSNGKIELVLSISGTGTSGSVEPTWATFFGGQTIDNAGGNQITWVQYGRLGRSTSIPIHAYDKHGNDYTSGIFTLTGNAQIVSGVGTVRVFDIPGGSITPGDQFSIRGATTSQLDGTWIVSTATLSVGIWTVTFATAAAAFVATPQIDGTLVDTLFDGNVVKLVFNTGLPNPSQGFVQAYLFQFLEREIVQLMVVGTNILSNSIMLEMETPQQILANPYMVLSTDQTEMVQYTGNADLTSRFNINRLGITPVS